ncbi:MAG TPA: OadG family transporter subunit [Ignavibacteriaceae bacterium]|jgi:Na+-transporting methylmalonyl-CoA/oxaloacetate decarboxylase gamma subunit|nr:OadG family transporter subunit [Ignavibacteriaceae bacterium]
MYYQVNADTLKSAADSLKNSINTDQLFNKIEFTPSNILNSQGIFISVVGYLVVFLALLLLYMMFINLSRFLQFRVRSKLQKKGEYNISGDKDISVSGEINAAISAALYLYLEEVHDIESTVLTIKKVQRSYSPWSSKIYGLRGYPGKRRN